MSEHLRCTANIYLALSPFNSYTQGRRMFTSWCIETVIVTHHTSTSSPTLLLYICIPLYICYIGTLLLPPSHHQTYLYIYLAHIHAWSR